VDVSDTSMAASVSSSTIIASAPGARHLQRPHATHALACRPTGVADPAFQACNHRRHLHRPWYPGEMVIPRRWRHPA
jgi:hypothetical protein